MPARHHFEPVGTLRLEEVSKFDSGCESQWLWCQLTLPNLPLGRTPLPRSSNRHLIRLSLASIDDRMNHQPAQARNAQCGFVLEVRASLAKTIPAPVLSIGVFRRIRRGNPKYCAADGGLKNYPEWVLRRIGNENSV